MKKGTKVALIAGAGLVTGTVLFFVLRNRISTNLPTQGGNTLIPGAGASSGSGSGSSGGSKYPEGTLLRAGDNDKVYYIDAQGYRHWIQTRAKFNSLGLSMSNVKSISSSEMNSIPTGTNIAGLSGVQQLLF